MSLPIRLFGLAISMNFRCFLEYGTDVPSVGVGRECFFKIRLHRSHYSYTAEILVLKKIKRRLSVHVLEPGCRLPIFPRLSARRHAAPACTSASPRTPGAMVLPRTGGADIPTVQDLLAHVDVATIQISTHVMKRPGLGVRSPLDAREEAG